MSFNERTIAVIGQEKADLISQKKVIVFGAGGVGGYVIEMLVRCGIGEIAIVDFASVSESNLNRQIIATIDNVGKNKVDCFLERIKSINPLCKVSIFCEKLLPENIDKFGLGNYDYVIDCIDMVTSKVALIKYCYQKSLPIISSMGTGNRSDIPKFEICDVFKTENDGLAKVMRKLLKENGVKKLNVCYTKQPAKKQKIIGSIAY